jgi:hypothetical protein
VTAELQALPELQALKDMWLGVWPTALSTWSPYIKLCEPTWCFTAKDEEREGLTGSFAMIRLVDHRVVISLRQIQEDNLQDFALQILAHEIGHHVYCPADLTDNARLMARLRKGLPSKEQHAPFIGNLYADLLINDRLQRSAGLSMAAVYQALQNPHLDRLWLLYMRTYELLWRLPNQTLAVGTVDARVNTDAQLCTRLIRNYSRDWVDGAGRFASLYLPYLLEEDDAAKARKQQAAWNDTQNAGQGGLPSGLTEIEEAETTGAVHPANDPDLSGIPAQLPSAPQDKGAGQTGHKSLKEYRGPIEYTELLKAAGSDLPQKVMIARYYKELAIPHLIRFPVREIARAVDPMPEGLDVWDSGAPLENIDWMGTMSVSPVVIPGFTTRERTYGSSPGSSPETVPLDLYLGIDCSGSMGNPSVSLSYPILAATIIALSALKARANVMVALSGEPGKTVTTGGFIRDENTILTTLTDYLGTGTTFGIHRLHPTFSTMPAARRPVHILIITDNDIFMMLNSTVDGRLGWDIAQSAAQSARGGATYVLQLPGYLMNQAGARRTIPPLEQRMERDGWHVSHVDNMAELVVFAKQFSQAKYHRG